MADQRLNVHIYGTEFTLRTPDDPEILIATASQVDREMRRIAQETGLMHPQKIATLTALHLADELAKVRRERDDLTARVASLCDRLEPLMDKAVEAPAP